MQETSHYQLAQWDEADRILREVFNRDNARIDAALAAAEAEAESDRAAWKAAVEAERAAWEAAVEAERSAREEAAAALAGRKSLELIETAVLETGGRYVPLPFGPVEWSRWKAVYFDFTLYLQSSGYCDIDVGGKTVLQVNGGGVSASGGPAGVSARLAVYPLYTPGAGVTAAPIGGGGPLVQAGTAYSGFRSFDLRAVASGNQMLAGCACRIWGER